MGKYDLPAFIDYIREYLDLAEDEKLIYVGHSQGNTEIYYGMIREPEYYRRNIKGIVSLSPIARISIVNKLIEIPAAMLLLASGDASFSGFFNFQSFLRWYLVHSCQIFRDACMIGTAFSVTSTTEPLEFDRLRTYYGHYPATSSFKCWKHWGQILFYGNLQEFDYGHEKNMEIYG